MPPTRSWPILRRRPAKPACLPASLIRVAIGPHHFDPQRIKKENRRSTRRQPHSGALRPGFLKKTFFKEKDTDETQSHLIIFIPDFRPDSIGRGMRQFIGADGEARAAGGHARNPPFRPAEDTQPR